MGKVFVKEYNTIKQMRRERGLSIEDHALIDKIQKELKKYNQDNITRTKAYLNFYKRHPEIKWALLASMVSRNAGWCMTDLKLSSYRKLLSDRYRKLLFLSYERPNWLIFSDAYPQLLIYEKSKQHRTSFFHLLKIFGVSIYMEWVWEAFLKEKEEQKLMYSLIINEQHVIEHPVLRQPFYKSTVFHTILFHLHESGRFNMVIFPTLKGELFGFPVFRFNHVNQRIETGKRLSWLLFRSPFHIAIQEFALYVEPTGSRKDYERFGNHPLVEQSDSLQSLYPVICHKRLNTSDWFNGWIHPKWYEKPKLPAYHIKKRYYQKRYLTHFMAQLFQKMTQIIPYRSEDSK